MYSAGSAFLEILPSFKGMAESITAEMRRDGDIGGKVYGEAFNKTAKATLNAAVGPSRAEALRRGTETGGAFADGFRARVTAALRDLPKPNVGVDATELDAELADVRARLQALSDARVGVDIRAGDAIAELDLLKARLDELGARSPDIRVKVDAAAAAAQLAAIQAEVDHLDHKDIDVSVNDRGSLAAATSGMSGLAVAGLALAPAIVPAAAAVVAGIAGIAAGAVAAVAGLGVLAIGLSGITKAVQELTSSHDATAASAAKSGAAQAAAAAAVANAEQQVKDARRGVADAERSGAQSIEQALRRQQDAEATLAAAQRTARQAQLDLSAARRSAKQDLEDLTLQVQDGALAQRQANLDVAAARQNLNKTLSDPSATALQRQQAQLAYDEAVQQVTDLTVRQRRLVEQQAAASKAGVAGAAGVVAATQRVKDTQDAVVKAQRDERIAAAAVTEARRAASESVVKAQERVISAERQLQVAHAQAANAAVAGTAETKKAFEDLGPAGQRLATFIAATVIPAFKHLRDVIQAHLAPGIEKGLRTLAPLLPGLTAVAGALAQTMGDLFASAAQALTDPFWTQFAAFIGTTIGPNLKIFAGILGNVATGFAGLFQAFAPVASQLGTGLESLTGRFATFGKTAGSNSGFQHFIAYVRDVGPKVVSTLGEVARAFGHIVEAVAPLGVFALDVIRGLARGINAIPVSVLGSLIVSLTTLALGIKGVIVVTEIWNAVSKANTIGLIVVALAALAAGLIYAYKNSETFRNVVKAAMHVVAAAFDFVKDHWKLFATVLVGMIAGPIAGAVVLLITHWTDVRHAARDVANFVIGKWNAIVGFFEKMAGRIARATVGMWDGIGAAFKATINTVIGWWDSFVSYLKIPGFSLDTHIPGVPTAHFGGLDIGKDLHIKPLAAGGVATGPQVNLWGEAGTEAILPLTDPRAMQVIGDSIARSMSRMSIPAALPVAGHGGAQALSGGGRGGLHIEHINVTSAPNERAELSLPKALRAQAWQMGFSDGF